MVAAAHPIEIGGIENVAPLVENRSVGASVHGNLAVAMKLPARDLQVVAAGGQTVGANRRAIRTFALRSRNDSWSGRRAQVSSLDWRRSGRQGNYVCVEIIIKRVDPAVAQELLKIPSLFQQTLSFAPRIGRLDDHQIARAARNQRWTIVENVVTAK